MIKLAKYRKQAGHTQQSLAEAVGCSWSYISQLERGIIKSPSVSKLGDIAKVLKVTIDELMG